MAAAILVGALAVTVGPRPDPAPIAGAVEAQQPSGGPESGARSELIVDRVPAVADASDDPAATAGWWSVVADLDARRADVLGSLDADLMGTYAVPGSPVWQQDAGIIDALTARAVRPAGLATTLVSVQQIRSDESRAELRVVDQRGAYDLVDAAGSTVESVAATQQRRWTLILERAGAGEPVAGSAPGWRISEASSAP